MKKLMILVSVILLPLTFSGQTVLMDEYPGSDTIVPKWGKNLKHYLHFYLGFSVFADGFSNKLATARIPASNEYTLGLRYKRKFTNFYAMGLDFSLNTQGVSIKQEDGKRFPDTIKYTKQSIAMSALSLEYYNRINFDRRGNKIGKFLDIGAYGFFNINSYNYTKTEYDTLSFGNSKNIEVKYFRPDYLNNYGYGASLRLGSNNFVLTARYRLSDLIKTDKYKEFPEMPRLLLGLQIGLH